MYYQMEVKFFYEQILLNLLRGKKGRKKDITPTNPNPQLLESIT